MPGFDPKPLGAIIALAGVAWFAMRQLGGREGRHYAVAVAGAVLIFGLDYAYQLPIYAYLAFILLAPFVYHRGIKTRLSGALGKLEPLELKDLGIRLVRFNDGSGKYLSLWRAEALEGEPDPAAESILARPQIVADVAAGSKPESLLMGLEFEGEMDDDYEVILGGDAPKGLSGQLMLFHRESVGDFTQIHAGHEEVENLPGSESWMKVRSDPPGYAFRLLDARAFETLHELFSLQTEERQMYTVVEGDKIRIVATRSFAESELPQFLGWGARWIQKVRETE